MPIQPEIALGVKQFQAPDAGKDIERALTFRDLLDRGKQNQQNLALGAENLKSTQLENAQKERAVKAQQTLAQALSQFTKIEPGDNGSADPATGEPIPGKPFSYTVDHDAVEGMLTRAGFPDMAAQYNKNRLEIENASLDHTIKQLSVEKTKHDQLGQMAQSILGAPKELRPALYSFTMKQAVSKGLIDQQLLPQIPQQYDDKTEAMLQQFSDQAQTDPYGQQLKRIQEARAATEAASKQKTEAAALLKTNVGTEAQLLGAAKNQDEWASALSQLGDRASMYPTQFSEQARAAAQAQGVSPDTRATVDAKGDTEVELAAKAAKGDKVAQKALDILVGQKNKEAQGKAQADMGILGGTTPAGQVAVSAAGGRNEDVLSRMTPGAAANVRQIADYKMALPTGMALRSPYWQAMLQKVSEYDPSFDASQYGVRFSTRKDFTSGKAATAMRSLNTAAQHLDKLDQSIESLDNYGGDTVASKGANYVVNTFAKKKAQNQLQIDLDAVANELENAYRAGGGSESGVKAWHESFDVDNSKDVQKNGVKEAAALVGGLINSLYNQYEKGIGKPADFNILDDKSRAVFKKLGVDVSKIDQNAASQPATQPGAKIITPDLMAKARKANPNVDDETLMKAMESKGFTRPQ